MHEYVAAPGKWHRLVAGHVVLAGNRLGGRDRPGLALRVGCHATGR
jgi:hypothetical protein